MRFLLKMIERIIQFQKNKKSWWKVVRFLECITVFVTTYALILPAISLSQDTARQQDGISLQESVDTVQEAAASGNDMSASSEQAEYDVEGSIQSSDNAVQEETVDAAALTGTVYPKSLDLRSEKRMDADAIMVIPQETVVTVLEDQGDGWLLISTPDGWSGYVKAAEIFLPDEKVEEKRPKMTFELIADRNSPDAEISEVFINGTFSDPIKVHVEAPLGAFPAGTTMKVRPIAEEQVREAVESVVPDPESVSRVSAVDITFLDVWGDEIEPDAEIKVSLTSTSIPTDQEPVVVHVDDRGQAEMVEAKKEEEKVVFESDKFSVYAVVETIEKYVLASDGYNYKISVTYGQDAGVPKGAELAVSEIMADESDVFETEKYEELIAKTGNTLGWDPEQASYFRLFDIKIVDENGEKVEILTPVDVKIELADKEAGEEAAANTQVIHFADGAETGDVVQGVEIEGETVSFSADGFSAYAIIEGPSAMQVNWHKVESVDELSTLGSSGLYIGHTKGYYFTSDVFQINSSRTGITKTTPAQKNYPASNAVKYYFEQVEGTDNGFKVYCLDGQSRKYIVQSSNSLNLTENSASASVFTIEPGTGENEFRAHGSGNYYWNMQGGDNGKSFAAYTGAGDVNAQFYFWYHDEIGSDPFGLDNTSCGLMFWDESLYGKAMMASSENANALDAKALMVLATADNSKKLFVPNDSDISMWTFHWDHDDCYYLTATVDGATKYLKIDTNGLTLVDSMNEADPMQVVPGTGTHAGQICLKSGNATLTYSGTAESGFSTGGDVGSEWLNLVELSALTSDYYKTYSATKVSVSDESITTGSKVIVYTRAWNEETLKYEYYAINHDGTLVPVYENGDSIEWVGNIINTMLWQFTDYPDEDGTSSYFYELYNEYAEKYLAPQVTGGQIVADDPIGINMNGRRNGQYYSTILSWDKDNYSYAGLKVENGQIVSCPKSEAMDFFFAVMEDIPVDDELKQVNTVDHTQNGITMKLVDFNSNVIQVDGSPTTSEQHAVMGTSAYTKWNEQPGLLSTNLENGYPTAVKTNKSLGVLFQGAKEVNHLFIESTYNASGYFEYDSAQNFASLNGAAGGNYTSGFDGNFTVYKELGTYDSKVSDTLKHGQFLPYNNIEAGRFASVNRQNLFSVAAESLPDSDPRKYENLYLVNDPAAADLYFGVELEASFTQTPDGLDDWGHDIIFEFTGDDDFWLYVDGELVIDLGGIHSALPGSVNFRTGDVYVNGKHTTLLDIFRENYKTRNSIADDSDERLINHLKEYFDYDETTGEFSRIFKNYSTHKMNIFYMERGGGASNLHMRFNLASVKPGTVELSKELAGIDESESPLAEFYYQIKYKKKNDPTEYLLKNSGGSSQEDYVFYKKTTNPVTFNASRRIGGVNYQNVFILKPGQTAVINFPASINEEIESYSIVECGVNTEVYNRVAVNGEELTGTTVSGTSDRKDYDIEYKSTGDRSRVNYVNTVNREAMRTLTFSKKLFDADGTTPIPNSQDGTTFDFRLYLSAESDTVLSGADMHTYHVRDENGNYCSWDAANQKFTKIGTGITEYTQLTSEQKVAASFSTSMNGAISRIPVDYTVEVREILAGTKFKVQERPAEIPDGYSFQKYVYYDNYDPDESDGRTATETYSGEDSDAVADAGAPDGNDHDGTVYNVIATGKDPHVDVCNLKGYGLRVNKVWTDADYMENRETTYFAVYTPNSSGSGNEHGHGQGLWKMVPGSLWALPYGTTTLYWYWLRLPVGDVSFDDYVIREVEIKHGTPAVDADGVVTNADDLNLKWVGEGELLTLNGTQKGETTEDTFSYTVQYTQGTISSESNVRVDTVTNTRPGIILKKQTWNGEPLAGATFSLSEEGSDTPIGTFTSDSEGYITTAFLSENKNYTLTETVAPQGYHGLETPAIIRVAGSTVTVSGPDSAYYSLTQASGTEPASLIIKNRPFIFQAIKQDGDTEIKLSDVHFELHKQVTVGGVTAFDEAVMTGYEDLVTDSEGMIPLIDNTLPAGTYQLREKAPLSGYQTLPGYVEFTVSKAGAISLLPSMSSAEWVSLDSEVSTGADETLVYTLIVRNYMDISVTVRKVDENERDLLGSKFRLWKYETSWAVVSEYSEIDLTSVNQKTLEKLSAGRYYLEEIQAPDEYVILEKYTYFNIAPDGTVSLTDAAGTGSNSNENASISDTGNIITVKNTSGNALPVTGGPGTGLHYILGGLLSVLGAVLLLLRKRRVL